MQTFPINDRTLELARIAVRDQLKIAGVFYIHEADFLEFIANAHRAAKKGARDNNEAFFREIIPWVSSLIQVFVEQANFLDAIKWVKTEFAEAEKQVSILTVLTTIFLIQRGFEQSEGKEPVVHEVWKEIRKRLDRLPVE